jgi:hypothetical protein
MSTFKDILYKKEDDETWTEWTKRVPDNNEDKLDYIRETIYVKIYDEDKEKAGEITDLLLCIGVEGLIPLLESEELLDATIEEAYKAVREFEELSISSKEVLSSEEELKVAKEQENRYDEEDDDNYLYPVKMITVSEMIEALRVLPPDAKLVMTESGFYSNFEFAEVMLPKLYTVENNRLPSKLPTGTQVYCIGHSHQSY